MGDRLLQKEIESLRIQLYKEYSKTNLKFQNEQVLYLSQRLDCLINKYYQVK